jgi:alginate O-acetyltransferase complex protein AlgI
MEFFCALIGLLVIVKNNTLRQYILLGASYIFYGAWSVNYLALIAACSFWGWWLGLLMSRTHSQKTKKLYLIISLVLSLGMLGYFKYANFFAENIINAFGLEWRHLDILLPVGISFFIFQTMSYTIDLYRGNIGVCKSAPKFFLFVAFFPQLVAGPIVRASEFLPQLDKKITFTKKNFLLGAQLFLGGALQKALVADNLSVFVDPVFSSPELYSPLTLWLALIGYSLQIFCDFSGYSLMAIGIAKILGFQLPVNFRMPYVSLSITEFWRR